MKKNKRKLNKSFQKPKLKNSFQNKLLLSFAFISLSIVCLLIAHFDFNRFYWFFIIGLLGFSFTSAFLLVDILECFLPSTLVNHRFWTGEGMAGRGLAGFIGMILTIAIMLGLTYLMKKMNVGYIV